MNGHTKSTRKRARRMHFVFFGWERSWPAFEGHEPPAKKLVELRSLPGNVVAAGANFEEADERLKTTLEAHFTRAGSASQWYDDAVKSLSDADVEEFKELLLRAVTQSEGFEEFGSDDRMYERALIQRTGQNDLALAR